MNRRRLALSAFLVGALACPTALHRWKDWLAIYPAFERARISEQERVGATGRIGTVRVQTEAETEVPAPQMLRPSPPVDSSYLPQASRPGYDGPADIFPFSIQENFKGIVAATAVLLPWFRDIVLGGVAAGIVGYLLPTFYSLIFLWIPTVAVSYVRWLNGPQA
jgi:hypothetical protein